MLRKLLRVLGIVLAAAIVIGAALLLYLEPYVTYDRDGAHLSLKKNAQDPDGTGATAALPEVSDAQIVYDEAQPGSNRISVNPEKESGKLTSLGQRAADSIAKFAGSWAFIFSFTGVLLAWMILNVLLAAKAFDPYPFILLNLVLSCVAAIQAPLIMMSQNRQEEKDRARAENDYKVNLKTEIMIEALHDKLNRILAREELLLQVQKEEHAPHYEKPEPKEN